MSSTLRVIIVPGWQNSGRGHWQTLWQESGHFERVAQDNWDHPTCPDWVGALSNHVLAQPGPVFLVAHSLGCITVAHLPPSVQAQVAGALLVAPADVERADAPPEVASFAPIPLTRLPYPSKVVASDNDPYCSVSRATLFAAAWNSGLEILAHAGHINAESGYGSWTNGWNALLELLDSVR